MNEANKCHYTDSIFYTMEQVVVYLRVKGAQFFNQLNLGITSDQFILLDAIYMNNDICQRDLSKIVLKDRSNTGRILTILEKNGFVKREIKTKGKRLVKKIYITEKGKALIENNEVKLRNAFEKVFDDVSEKEFEILREILVKVKNSLSKTTTIQI